MFGYTGIKYIDEKDCLRGFWVLEINADGDCWSSIGPYGTFAQAREHGYGGDSGASHYVDPA